MAFEFRLLGEVEVVADGRPIDIGHARQRCVTAALLVDANRPVSIDQLADRVWGSQPPQRYREVLYSYVSRLRRVLNAAENAAVQRGRDGYVFSVDPAAVDLHLFPALLDRARADDDASALALFEQALGLWRGEAFGTLDSAWLATVRACLDKQRLAAELDRNDARLRCGQHHGLAADLPSQVARHPLNERLTGQLMRALYHSGQAAEALDAYRRLRRRLVDELGVDPGPDVQRLELAILRNELTPVNGVKTCAAAKARAGPAPRPVLEPVPLGRLPDTTRPAVLVCLLVLLILLGSAVVARWTGNGAQPVQRVQVGNVSPWAHLHTEPRDDCAEQECEVPSAEIRPADYVVVFCYTSGDMMADVNGVRSTAWYGTQLANGDIAYIPEVYLESHYRGGLELPRCTTGARHSAGKSEPMEAT